METYRAVVNVTYLRILDSIACNSELSYIHNHRSACNACFCHDSEGRAVDHIRSQRSRFSSTSILAGVRSHQDPCRLWMDAALQ